MLTDESLEWLEAEPNTIAELIVKSSCKKNVSSIESTEPRTNAEKKKKKLNELNILELKKIEPKLTEKVLKVFDLKYSINSKKSYGGTSFYNIKKMITKHKRA